MHEDTRKYAPDRAQRFETSPMVDAPVIMFAGRTAPELVAPLAIGVLLVILGHQLVLALVVTPVLFWLVPGLRRRLGRGRLLHILWSWGLVRTRGAPHLFGPGRSTRHFGP